MTNTALIPVRGYTAVAITSEVRRYQVSGNVSRLGVDGAYRVRICRRDNGVVLNETWSALNGDYLFQFLPNLPLTVYALDHMSSPLNAAIADLVTPELMP